MLANHANHFTGQAQPLLGLVRTDTNAHPWPEIKEIVPRQALHIPIQGVPAASREIQLVQEDQLVIPSQPKGTLAVLFAILEPNIVGALVCARI